MLQSEHGTVPRIDPSSFHAFAWLGQIAKESAVLDQARLVANSHHLEFAVQQMVFTIPLGKVRKISRGGMYPWFFRGLRVHHSIPGYPEDLQFKAEGASFTEMKLKLAALGYPI